MHSERAKAAAGERLARQRLDFPSSACGYGEVECSYGPHFEVPAKLDEAVRNWVLTTQGNRL